MGGLSILPDQHCIEIEKGYRIDKVAVDKL